MVLHKHGYRYRYSACIALRLTGRNQSIDKQCIEFVCGIEVVGLALVGSVGDVILSQFLDGSEDGVGATCAQGRMI